MKYTEENQGLINQTFENQYTRIAKERFTTESSWATCLNTMLAYGEGIIQFLEADPAFDPKGGDIFKKEVSDMRILILEYAKQNTLTFQKVRECIETFKKLRVYIDGK